MTKPIKAMLLCIEDDPKWQAKVKASVNGEFNNVRVDSAQTYGKAVDLLTRRRYDVVTVDSRLQKQVPRIHQVITAVGDLPDEKPVLVALTNFAGNDISKADRRQLFRVIQKEDVQDDAIALKKRLMPALRESLRIQARRLLKRVGQKNFPTSDDEMFCFLEDMAKGAPRNVQRQAKRILGKFAVYRAHWLTIPEKLLECPGTVTALHEDNVEVCLNLSKEHRVTRVFSSDRFTAAQLYFEGASFTYKIVRLGSEVRSYLERRTPSRRRSFSVDLSVFDDFDSNPAIVNEQKSQRKPPSRR